MYSPFIIQKIDLFITLLQISLTTMKENSQKQALS